MQTVDITTPAQDEQEHDAAADPLALQLYELNDFISEIRLQPFWRERANTEVDYYDGNQANGELLAQLEELGIAWVPENLVKPTINAVLGLEAKTRTDWRVAPANDKRWQDVSDAANVKLNEAEKETGADRAQAEAYAAQTKAGVGWIEVSRNSNPFAPSPYRVKSVHRGQIFWDWQAREPDLTDGRYLIRKQRYHIDILAAALPEKKDLLTSLIGGIGMLATLDSGASSMQRDLATERQFAWDDDWLHAIERRVMIYEVWYRRWVRAQVIRIIGTHTSAEYQPDNPFHVQLLQSGRAEIIDAVFPKMRVSWWAGPYKLFDRETPYQHNDFPYVPFWGFREDLTGIPYGLIRDMVPMQDEINARNSKLLWLLAAKRIEMTEGILKNMDDRQAAIEATRPNAHFILDAAMVQSGGFFKVITDFQRAAEQYKLLVDKRGQLKNVAGVYASFEGHTEKGVTAGIALQTLVEQSNQSLGKINDNFRFGRQKVGELLLSLILEDIGNRREEIVVDVPGKQPKTVILNEMVQLANGLAGLNNAVQQARLKVQLSEVPSTASYRQQQLQQMTQIMQSLPPEMQGLLLDFYVSLTDSPYRDAIVERIQNALNLSTEEDKAKLPKTPEALQTLLQQTVQQAVQEAMQNLEAQLQLRESAREDRKLDQKDRELNLKAAELEHIKAYDAETKRMKVNNDDEHMSLQKGIDFVSAQSVKESSNKSSQPELTPSV